MTRLTSDERLAIELQLDALQVEIDTITAQMSRLRGILAAQPDGSDGDTIRLLVPLCRCGLPLDHRNPTTGEPRPCDDETARIALPDAGRSRPPVPAPVIVQGIAIPAAIAGRLALDVVDDGAGLRYCCRLGEAVYPAACSEHGRQA